jgi:glycosyltransferase involved in cell wall biosynthesis
VAFIGIDGSILLHGERAGKRHSRNLLGQLVRRYVRDEWRLLYFDRRGNTPGRIPLDPKGLAREAVSRIPMRLISGAWRRLGCPSAENWTGPVDVFYAPDLFFPPTRRAPVLCTIRGLAYLAIPHLCEPAKRSALTGAFEYARRRAHHFLAVSESTRRDLLRMTDISADRIHVVTHGVDPIFRPLDRGECRSSIARKFGVERPFLLYVGVIGRHKNVMGILTAYSTSGLCREGMDLVLAGPFESEIKNARSFAVQKGLDKSVHFIGDVNQEDATLVELYNSAVALVHASFYEGWCATPLEAMACGTAVVASDIPAVREVVQDAATLAPPDDLDAWKTAMVRMASDENHRSVLAEKGLLLVRQHTWKRAAKRLRRVLTTVQEMGR